jgi:hypothetical protein
MLNLTLLAEVTILTRLLGSELASSWNQNVYRSSPLILEPCGHFYPREMLTRCSRSRAPR